MRIIFYIIVIFVATMQFSSAYVEESKATKKHSSAKQSKLEKAVDDRCFIAYSQAAGNCNQDAGEDDVAFSKCLKPVKKGLRDCCAKGGSPKCAQDAVDK